MIIINSAAYVIPEFQSELGAIPPCMLPLGNQKLIQHQVKLLRKFENERIIVTLPLSYKLTLGEKSLINELDIDTVFIPDNFSLANALIYAINMFESYEKNNVSSIPVIRMDVVDRGVTTTIWTKRI